MKRTLRENPTEKAEIEYRREVNEILEIKPQAFDCMEDVQKGQTSDARAQFTPSPASAAVTIALIGQAR